MPSYETLDAIADSYNPALAVIALVLIGTRLLKAHWKPASQGMTGFAFVAFVAYGFMYLDRGLNIWAAFGLDYSTHTATAFGLVLLLSFQKRKLAPLWLVSLLLYVVLMLYQRYHTITDIVTTAIVVAIPLGLLLPRICCSGENEHWEGADTVERDL